MVEGNASMYLGSPRMAEMVIGERATLEEMGAAAVFPPGTVIAEAALDLLEKLSVQLGH